MRTLKCLLMAAWIAASTLFAGAASAELAEVIERVKPSVVVIGTYQLTRSPQFVMRGTGFVVGDGRQVATNSHVLPEVLDTAAGETLVVASRAGPSGAQQRSARAVAVDKAHDIALLRIDGQALPALTLHESAPVREGQSIAFTGFPIGSVLGFIPVTHRGIVSAITPIALPSPTARQLSGTLINRLKNGAFDIFQLDATAYPGNSGSPVYDEETAAVIGIINMVYVKGSKEAALSQPSGISYAIPVDYLARLLAQRP